MAAQPIEAESSSLDCEKLPTYDYVFDERTYQNRISQTMIDRHSDRHLDRNLAHQLAVPGYGQERERQPVNTGVFNGDSSHHGQPSSYLSEPPHSGGFRSGFQSQPSSSIRKSMEQFRLASIPKQSLNIEGSQENYGSSSVNGNNITYHPSSYDHTAAYGMASQDASLGNKHKVVLLNNSAVLKQLNHPHTNQHVYHNEINNSQDSALQRNAERNPLSLRNEQLNQQNGMTNQSVHSIHGQPASVDQPALLDQPASGIQSQHPRPLSIRNNHLNQHNGTVNQSIEGLPIRITAATPNMETRQLRNETPLSAHMNGGVVSQGVGMEVNQCTSFGQVEEPPRLPQKTENPMSLWNTRMNRENFVNQSVPPQLDNQTPSVVAYHSLYRDQGDQESHNTSNQHGVLQGPPQNSQQLRNQGDQQSLGSAPFHGYNQHGVLQGPPQNSQEFRSQGDQGSSGIVPFDGHNQHEVSQSSSHRNRPQLDNSKKSKKVFIVYFSDGPLENSPVLKLALCLRRMDVDVTADFFEYDNPPNSWPIWYEQKIKDSNIVLCIITENFYHQLTNGNHVVGYSVYNLMNSSRNIAFRAVFIDADKREMMEYVPPAMQGATSYSISSNQLTPNHEEFANLYAFLTGQNRVEKPPLGKRIVLAPKKGRFSHFSGGPAPAPNRNMQQQQQQRQPWQQQGMMYQPAPPPQPSPAPAVNPPDVPNVEQANFIFTLLGGDPTPIKSIRSHNKMFMQLASKMTAEWEGLGRLLNVSEPDIYAIKMDNIHSVTEQAVQMFRQWLMKNGSKATLGGLTTAVYDSGPQYWNLLDTINNYAPQQ